MILNYIVFLRTQTHKTCTESPVVCVRGLIYLQWTGGGDWREVTFLQKLGYSCYRHDFLPFFLSLQSLAYDEETLIN